MEGITLIKYLVRLGKSLFFIILLSFLFIHPNIVYAVNIPGKPVLSNPTTSSLKISINTNANSTSTTYALYNVTTNNYITSLGIATLSPTFFTSSTWNDGSAIGLSPNKNYQFSAIAKSSLGVLSATSTVSTALYTLANTAGAPAVLSPTISTLKIILDTNNNPANTTYAIFNNTTNNYLTSGGTSNGATPAFFTSSTWNNGTAKALSSNTPYRFSVISRNGNNINSATSSPSIFLFTAANVAGTPLTSNPSTSSIQLSIVTNNNPTSTTYAIFNTTNNTYSANDGTPSLSPVFFTSSSWSGIVKGLNPNTSYRFGVIARNGDGIVSTTSTLSTALYTLANSTDAPLISNPAATTLKITILTNGNPASVTYAIFNATTRTYLTSGGTSNSTTPAFFASSTWNNGTAKGLTPNTAYQFSIIARNTSGAVTPTSSISLPLFTLANAALAPTVTNPTTSTLKLAINVNNNPSSTTYAIFNTTSGTYVKNDGSSNGPTPVFFTSSSWNGIVKDLSSGTSYRFSITAKNGDGVVSATSTLSTAISTVAAAINTPGIPVVSNPTTSSLQIVLNTNGNPASATYALFNTTLGKYLTANGLPSAVPVFFTSSSWNGTVTGLTFNTPYQFVAIAKSSGGILSATSTPSTAVFTLANQPGSPLVLNPTPSSLQLNIATGNNPPSTTYAIYNSTKGNYIASTGASNGETPEYFTSSSWNGMVTGLSPLTSYQFITIARNGNGILSPSSSLSVATSTLPMPIGVPLLSHPTTSSLQLSIDTVTNSSSTTYALYNLTDRVYLNATGTSNGAAPLFFTSSSWNGIVYGLKNNTVYQFAVIPTGGTTSSASMPLFTLAETPDAPLITNATTSTLDLQIQSSTNPTSTTFALFNPDTGYYLATDGSTSTMPLFFTTSLWGGTVEKLSPNTSYQFTTIGRNGDGIPTATSSPSSRIFTVASVPLITSITNSLDHISISWDGDATDYLVDNLSSGSNSGWMTGKSFTLGGLSCNTNVILRVKGRNGDGIETPFSTTTSTATLTCPPITSVGSGGSAGGGIYITASGPTDTHLFINDEATSTFSPIVTLTLKATNAQTMIISNNPYFNNNAWENYSPTKVWTVSSDYGNKTIYARFRTSDGILSDVISGTIQLTAPYTTETILPSSSLPSSTSVLPEKILQPVLTPPTQQLLRNLSIGSKGTDVKILQKFLNDNGFIIAKNGSGSPGKETTLFGQATRNSLRKFQDQFLSSTPNKKGQLGPETRKFINALL